MKTTRFLSRGRNCYFRARQNDNRLPARDESRARIGVFHFARCKKAVFIVILVLVVIVVLIVVRKFAHVCRMSERHRRARRCLHTKLSRRALHPEAEKRRVGEPCSRLRAIITCPLKTNCWHTLSPSLHVPLIDSSGPSV